MKEEKFGYLPAFCPTKPFSGFFDAIYSMDDIARLNGIINEQLAETKTVLGGEGLTNLIIDAIVSDSSGILG